MFEAQQDQRELTRRNDLRRDEGNGLDCMSKAPAIQQATKTEHVIVHVAHEYAAHAGPGERDQLTQALGAAVGVDVNRPALPAGTDRRDACGKRLAQAVARWNDDQRDAGLAAC